MYRIVTRPDFDGVACAVLLRQALTTEEAVLWREPYEISKETPEIGARDVIANLPYHPHAAYWFDHHHTNASDGDTGNVPGAFEVQPSAARVVYRYFDGRLDPRYAELVAEADKIDAARMSEEEIRNPRSNPYAEIALTLGGEREQEESYWNWLVGQLAELAVDKVAAMPPVQRRVEDALAQDREYRQLLQKYTSMHENVSVTDLRALSEWPSGNRFTVFSLFPECNANVKIRYSRDDPSRAVLSMSHSITNRTCDVDLGKIAADYGGGGHFGAASFSVARGREDEALRDVLERLRE
jgi:hypothetical protein